MTLSPLLDDLAFHNNSNYSNIWNKSKNRDYNLFKLKNRNVKLRIFDQVFDKFYTLDALFYVIMAGERLKSNYSTDHPNACLPLQAKIEEKSSIRIIGHYNTKTHITLCTMPTAKTLISAYERSPVNTLTQIKNLLGKKQEFLAVDLVNSAYELLK